MYVWSDSIHPGKREYNEVRRQMGEWLYFDHTVVNLEFDLNCGLYSNRLTSSTILIKNTDLDSFGSRKSSSSRSELFVELDNFRRLGMMRSYSYTSVDKSMGLLQQHTIQAWCSQEPSTVEYMWRTLTPWLLQDTWARCLLAAFAFYFQIVCETWRLVKALLHKQRYLKTFSHVNSALDWHSRAP